ncbi:Tol-Pal system peptidoglycan-associated lipoprotein PAL [hydrothermal vent metagenome]|uniref:Tol-Pal system peptidoglycan-associated lipoprotein PAL n=1 Tax=hydrothermal vent metagenome TaxID=652676 RepID=A0A3B0RWB6_9ZZZZ
MLRKIAGPKVFVVAFSLLTLAGCAANNKPDVANPQAKAKPGTERDFILNVGDRVHFIVNQSTLTPQAMDTLRKQAAWLAQYPNVTIQIEGHADERGTREYNIALSARRATAARQFLVSSGVQASRLSTIAYGKERPVALCDAENCWNQNRRAVTVITGGAIPG